MRRFHLTLRTEKKNAGKFTVAGRQKLETEIDAPTPFLAQTRAIKKYKNKGVTIAEVLGIIEVIK